MPFNGQNDEKRGRIGSKWWKGAKWNILNQKGNGYLSRTCHGYHIALYGHFLLTRDRYIDTLYRTKLFVFDQGHLMFYNFFCPTDPYSTFGKCQNGEKNAI
jgi:hypothetical protein